MSDPRPGWYADPGGQADLRWWDGRAWTDSTRSHPDTTPPAEAITEPTPIVSSGPLPITDTAPTPATVSAPSPASSLPPGSFAPWTEPSPTPPPVPPVPPVPPPTLPSGPSAFPPGPPGVPPQPPADRSWVPWALTGAGVALIVVLVGFLVVSVLGSSSTPASSPSAASSSTTAAPTSTAPGGSSTTSPTTTPTTPSTPTSPPPPYTPNGPAGSVLYTDPGGNFSVSVSGQWVSAPRRIDGIPVWWMATRDAQGVRPAIDVTSEPLTYSTGLDEYVAMAEEVLQAQAEFHLLSSTDLRLADGVPAKVIRYETLQHGITLQGEAVVAVSNTVAVVVTVTAGTTDAATVFQQAYPYVRTLHLL